MLSRLAVEVGDEGVQIVLGVVLFLTPQLGQRLERRPESGWQTSAAAAAVGRIRHRGSAGRFLLTALDVVQGEQVQQLVGGHRLQAGVLGADDRVGCVQFELLQTHDLLLERAARDQPVHGDDLFLADAVRPVHGLQVLHRVPVVFHEDHRVGARQVQSQATHLQTFNMERRFKKRRLIQFLPTGLH